MSRYLLVGCGAAGNKCAYQAIKSGAISENDVVLVNSTDKDFPADYNGKKIVISPLNLGAGKEREVSKAYVVNSIKQGLFDTKELDNLNQYANVILVSSVEGGTGSGAVPMLAQYFATVHVKNVTCCLFAGFQDDPRGLANTIECFKELKDNIIVHIISNSAFLAEADGNYSKAEELANQEFINRYKILSGQLLIPGDQNIDDTDIIKLSNTYGYTTIEYKELDKSLSDPSEYDKIIKRMSYDSKSIKPSSMSATKIGVILNLSEQSRTNLNNIFSALKETYGVAYECFKHIQYDGKKEYIAYIIAGMKLPIDEVQKVYDKYTEQSKLVNKNSDGFFDSMKKMTLLEEDKQFNMIKPVKKGISSEEFLSNL